MVERGHMIEEGDLLEPKIVEFQGEKLLVHPDTQLILFRELNEVDREEFVKWAWRQTEGNKVSPLWHPVTQNELLVSGRGRL